MLFKKHIFIFAFTAASLAPNFAAADEVPVLIRVKSSEQADSLGCNFVQQVTALVYNLILDNKIKLWDSQQKEIQITGPSLKEIEKTSGTEFLKQDIIFIYEMWISSKRELSSKTIGFTFLDKDSRGQEVAYGYVDFNDVRSFFMNTNVETNADGYFNQTFMYFLSRKNFNFNVVQIYGKVLSNVTESQEALATFKGKLEFGGDIDAEDEIKSVTYVIDRKSTIDSAKSANAKAMFETIENYLLENKEEFYNLGGDRLENYVKGNFKIYVTAIEVHEFWKKINDQIIYEPRGVTIFVNDSALNTIPLMDLVRLELNVGEKRFVIMLIEKQFNLIISRINYQKIPRKEAFLYYKALQTFNWNQVIEFVKYY